MLVTVLVHCHFIKRGASSRWSFGPNSTWGSIETTTIGRMHPTLWCSVGHQYSKDGANVQNRPKHHDVTHITVTYCQTFQESKFLVAFLVDQIKETFELRNHRRSMIGCIWVMSHHPEILINQSDIKTKIYREKTFWAEQINIFSLFWMAGFNFDAGGRRCIRPILEKYQSGKGR